MQINSYPSLVLSSVLTMFIVNGWVPEIEGILELLTLLWHSHC